MVKWGGGVGCPYHSTINGKNPLSKSWKTEHFSVLTLFFHCPSLNSGTATPIQIEFSKLTRINLLAHRVHSHEI